MFLRLCPFVVKKNVTPVATKSQKFDYTFFMKWRIMEPVTTVMIDNGHNNFNDENTIILCVELTDGLLLSHGTRYEF